LFDKCAIPSPGRPLLQAASANFNSHAQTKVDTKNEDRGPLLITMGGKDHTVPEAISKSTYKQYRHSEATTELTEFRRPRPLADHRPPLAGDRRLRPVVAES
jgi:hypothetical protein